jgi:hypothetical protein
MIKPLLALLMLLGSADERILWYYDADSALRTAERSGRPIVLLKIRADIGKDVKT